MALQLPGCKIHSMRKYFFTSFFTLVLTMPAAAVNVSTSGEFASAWNAPQSSITMLNDINLGNNLTGFAGANLLMSGSNNTLNLNGGRQFNFTTGSAAAFNGQIQDMRIMGSTIGAIRMQQTANAARYFGMENVSMKSNSVSTYGGAIFMNMQMQGAGSLNSDLRNSNFIGNSAVNGGAIYMTSNNSSNSGRTNNFSIVSDTGDGVFALNQVWDGTPNPSGNCNGNTSSNGKCVGWGGSVYFAANNAGAGVTNNFTIQGYTHFQNWGGGLGGSVFAGVTGGAATANNNFAITDNSFVQNAASIGGAIAIEFNGGSATNTLNIDSVFQSNTATSSGGAIFHAVGDLAAPIGGSVTSQIGGTFSDNRARDGGAIYNYVMAGGANVITTISGIFTNNAAEGSGGAIYNVSSGSAALKIDAGTTFSGNRAATGGAIFNSGTGWINFNTAAGNDIVFENNSAANIASGMGIFQSSAGAIINILGDGNFNMNDGIAGIGTINQNSGNTMNMETASNSGRFTGAFNQSAGTTLNMQGTMFGGQNNIGGTANIWSGQDTIYFNANMLSNSVMNFTSTSNSDIFISQATTASAPGIRFVGSGATVNFTADAGLMGFFQLNQDITNGQANTINFLNSEVMFAAVNFTGQTVYNFNTGSLIDLASSSAGFQNFTFRHINSDDTALLSFKIGTEAAVGADGNNIITDTLTAMNGSGLLGLGRISIDNRAGDFMGPDDFSWREQIIFGDTDLRFQNGLEQFIVTGNHVYRLTTMDDYFIGIEDLEAFLTLNDINAMLPEAVMVFCGIGADPSTCRPDYRSFQLGHSDIYYNETNLDDMVEGIFVVMGIDAMERNATLSGFQLLDPDTVEIDTMVRQSLFNIVNDNTYFTLIDLVIQDAFRADGGSVLNMDNENSTASLWNLLIQRTGSGTNGGAINITAGAFDGDGIDFVNNLATGNGGAVFNSGETLISGSTFQNNTAMNGGAIFNESDSMELQSGTIGMLFSGNTAKADGGAIFNDGTMTMNIAADAIMLFQENFAGTVGNDIHNAGTIDFVSDGGTVFLGGGFSGTTGGTINMDTNLALILGAGSDSSNFLGAFNQSSGLLDVNGGFFGGDGNISGGQVNWNMDAWKTDESNLNMTAGTLVVGGNLRLTEGDLVGPGTTVALLGTASLDLAGGTFFFNERGIALEPDSLGIHPMMAVNALNHSDGFLVISGTDVTPHIMDYIQTGGILKVKNNAAVSIHAPNRIGGDIIVSNSTLNILGGHMLTRADLTADVTPTTGAFLAGDNALINSITGALSRHEFEGNFGIISMLSDTATGSVRFAVDLDAQNFISDMFVFSGIYEADARVMTGHANPDAGIDHLYSVGGSVTLSDINFLNAPRTETVPFTIMQLGVAPFGITAASSDLNDLEFLATDATFMTASGEYELISLGAGNFQLQRVGNNDASNRGAVAHRSWLNSQNLITGAMFDHVFLDSTTCIYNCRYHPWQFENHKYGVWARALGGTDRMRVTGDGGRINDDTVGFIIGVDLPASYSGFDEETQRYSYRWLPTFYMAYTASRQIFQGVNQEQQGLQIGMQNTISNGNWMAALMGYAGFYNNNIDVGGLRDNLDSWFAGIGGKVGYNYHFDSMKLILQPSVRMVYNYVDSKTWDSDFGNIDMATGYLQGFGVSPGVSAIFGFWGLNGNLSVRHTWQFTNEMIQTVGYIDLPDIVMPDSFFEVTAGMVGSFTDSWTVDATLGTRLGADITGFHGRLGTSYRF